MQVALGLVYPLYFECRENSRVQSAPFFVFMDPQKSENKQEKMLNLGVWLGRHRAFGLIANRCSAADAECLKAIRDGGEYKELGLSWEQFCEKHAGVSRYQANRQIHYLEEFGANYFRLSEVMAISPDTYRLIAGSVTEEGLEFGGERFALIPENRVKIGAAVSAARSKTDGDATIAALRKKLDALIAEVRDIARQATGRNELIVLLEEGRQRLEWLSEAVRDQKKPIL